MAEGTEKIIVEEGQVEQLLRQGEILQIEQILKKEKKWTVDLTILQCLINVFHNEVRFEESFTIFDYSLELNELKRHFVKVKLLLRRLEFDLPMVDQMELYDYCTETAVSKYLISHIIRNNIFFQEKVCIRVIDIYSKKEGMDSEKTKYFISLLQSLKEKEHG